jgi:uncharacterized protein (TIRG00374 family)
VTPQSRRGRKAWALVRALVGFGLLTLVLVRLDARRVFETLSTPVWSALAAACAAQMAAKLVWAQRWREILRANGLERGFLDLLALVFMGLFFNSFLPTSVGGDLVRGYYASRGREGMVTSYAVLLVERSLGMITLALMATLAAAVALATGSTPLSAQLLLGITLGGVVITAGGALAFGWRGWRRRLIHGEPFGAKVAKAARGLDRALDLFRSPRAPRARILLNSSLLQVIAVLFHIGCARAVGLETAAGVFFLIVPASVVASMLPVSLNGLGLREGVLVGLLVAVGAPPDAAGAFAVLALLVSTAFALVGGIINPFYNAPRGEAERVPLDS